MDRISDTERQRIAELLAEGAPVWRLHQEINRSRYAIRRAVVALHRPPKREPRRSPLRLSLAEREEISRGLAAGEPVREIARGVSQEPAQFHSLSVIPLGRRIDGVDTGQPRNWAMVG
jgi:IS30 family transposase